MNDCEWMYGSYRNYKFTDIWDNASDFLDDYNDSGMRGTPEYITDDNVRLLYNLLYANYGNSTIASCDPTQFQYKLYSIIFQYGPAWQARLKVQLKLKDLDLDSPELTSGSEQIYNHAYHPGNGITSQDGLLDNVNEQTHAMKKRGQLEGYDYLLSLLDTDVTGEFINKFKKLFITVVAPEMPLWYVTEGDN